MALDRSFLDLCVKLREEIEEPGDGPSSVLGNTGLEARIVDWIYQANQEIQSSQPNWRFMWSSGTGAATTGSSDYDISNDWSIADLMLFNPLSFRIYKDSEGVAYERALPFLEYEDWLRLYAPAFGSVSNTPPSFITQLPDGTMRLSHPADGAYTITFDYYRDVQDMTANDDLPYIPEPYRFIIVAQAMMYYGDFNNAPETYNRGESWFKHWKRQLMRKELPKVRICGPLA